ncbi:SpoIIE family protein phosphatase [Hahella sp. CR1]|uniref:SpoIIE family protein phosphatase n=1 Tax=Hahella sp. CR1 TaxID=2992807 RepID=UPI002441BAD0|nr:SpoIIE family protein phosphatase [Hahella sp. CR1]MDG9667828.1 SpoIIE family protein phosphatase [Hahella sp. CR1]
MADLEEALLIIDSDEDVSRHMKEHLTSRGFHVVHCASVKCFTDLKAQVTPDIIIGDLTSDDIKSLYSLLKDVHPRPPIVIHSKRAGAEDILGALRSGASDYIVKPVADVAVLDEAIQRQIDQVRVYRENQQYRYDLELANKELRAGLEELQADQRAGRHVQMKMLPEREVEYGGIQFDHCIKPSLYLSGDFFDYFRLSGDKIAFYFADVSGHGASSAFVTVLLKNLSNRLQRNLRRQSSDDILYPDRFLKRVNAELLDTDLGKHLTMFAGVIDLQTRVLSYSMGAHFPMPVMSVNGVSRYLDGKGPPVGLFDDPVYPLYEEPLALGFSLVICSDGLLEVINAKSLAEKEQALLETVQEARHTIPELEKAFGLRWITELPDDIAIVSIMETTV